MNRVRRAVPDDIPALLNLLLQVDMVHHNGRPDLFKGNTTKYDKSRLLKMIEDDNDPIFVCVDEYGKVLAHAFCITKQITDDRVLTDIKTLYIDDICVDEDVRGQGVGRTVFEYLEEYARANGYYNITLNVWTCNPGAVKFYESLGMSPRKIGMELLL